MIRIRRGEGYIYIYIYEPFLTAMAQVLPYRTQLWEDETRNKPADNFHHRDLIQGSAQEEGVCYRGVIRIFVY